MIMDDCSLPYLFQASLKAACGRAGLLGANGRLRLPAEVFCPKQLVAQITSSTAAASIPDWEIKVLMTAAPRDCAHLRERAIEAMNSANGGATGVDDAGVSHTILDSQVGALFGTYSETRNWLSFFAIPSSTEP